MMYILHFRVSLFELKSKPDVTQYCHVTDVGKVTVPPASLTLALQGDTVNSSMYDFKLVCACVRTRAFPHKAYNVTSLRVYVGYMCLLAFILCLKESCVSLVHYGGSGKKALLTKSTSKPGI